MSKPKTQRRIGQAEAMAKVRTLRTSPRKLNLVAASIRGLKVQRALNELEFSHKRIAKDVRKALYSAISNAENNHNLDIDSLVVAEASRRPTPSWWPRTSPSSSSAASPSGGP